MKADSNECSASGFLLVVPIPAPTDPAPQQNQTKCQIGLRIIGSPLLPIQRSTDIRGVDFQKQTDEKKRRQRQQNPQQPVAKPPGCSTYHACRQSGQPELVNRGNLIADFGISRTGYQRQRGRAAQGCG